MTRKIGLVFLFVYLSCMVAVPAVDRDKRYGGTLTAVGHFSSDGWKKNFNPLSPDVLFYTMDFMFEPLVIYDIMNGGKLVPRLATGLTYTKDSKSIIYALRKGVRWSDGAAFDADDVLFTYKLIKKYPVLDTHRLWENFIGNVKKIDRYHVRFNLQRINATAEWMIAEQAIVPEHQWHAIKDPVTFTNPDPVGTGPFTEIRFFSPDVYEQCRNPYYWEEGRPYLDCLRFPRYRGNKEALKALVNGDIDWASIFVPGVESVYVRANPKHHHYWFPPDATIYLYMNTTREPFHDRAFRQSLSMAIDRNKIVENATYNYAHVAMYPIGIGELYREWFDPGAVACAGKTGTYAPHESEMLLDRAGYKDKNGDGFRQFPDGGTLRIEIMTVKGWNDWESAVRMIAGYFKDIGVDAEVVPVKSDLWLQRLESGWYAMSIGSGKTTPSPWGVYYNLLNSELMKGKAQGLSWSRWSSPEADTLLDAYGRTRKPSAQRRIVGALQRIVAQNVPVIPLFSSPLWYEYNDTRFVGWANADNPYLRPACYYHERLLHVINLSLRPQ